VTAPSGHPARAAPPRSVTNALAEAAALGPYFDLAIGDETQRWQPAADLYHAGLDSFIAAASEQLGVTETRVSASIVQLGHASRLWSPVLASALLCGVVPDLADLRVRPERPVRLGVPAPGGWLAADPAEMARLAYRAVMTEQVEPLVRGLRVKVADGLLWGNAASAMTGALSVLVAARPDQEQAARTLAGLLLNTGRLRGTGIFTGPGIEFRRNSCCLYYRVPGGGTCADCSLTAPAP
jgi:hypothetical protein